MVRSLLCAVQMLLAVAFSMPGCGRNGSALRPPAPALEPGGLRIGSLAPEITGEDIDGASFQLSDYRGKVVLLDFWGNW